MSFSIVKQAAISCSSNQVRVIRIQVVWRMLLWVVLIRMILMVLPMRLLTMSSMLQHITGYIGVSRGGRGRGLVMGVWGWMVIACCRWTEMKQQCNRRTVKTINEQKFQNIATWWGCQLCIGWNVIDNEITANIVLINLNLPWSHCIKMVCMGWRNIMQIRWMYGWRRYWWKGSGGW